MKKIFKRAFLGITLLASFNLSAMDEAAIEMLKSMKIDKAQVSEMVDHLQKMGKITPEQAAKAKRELSGLSEKDLDKYKSAAVKKIKSGDAQRIINHDYTKSEPKLEPPSVLEVDNTQKSRMPASVPKEKASSPKIDFSKLGQ